MSANGDDRPTPFRAAFGRITGPELIGREGFVDKLTHEATLQAS